MTETGKKQQNTKKSGSVNVGMLIFGAVLLYLIAMTLLYFMKDRITSYEVKIGKLSYSISATGIILRDETVYTTDKGGDITFYASEGDKVRVGSNIYSMGTAGSTAGAIAGFEGDTSLDSHDYAKLENDANEFQGSYDPVYFERTYDFAYRLESELLDIYNRNILEQLQAQSDSLNVVKATDDGIIGYTIDGYEDLTIDDLDKKLFDHSAYKKIDIRENTEIPAGSPVYKLVTNEKWSVVIPVRQEDFVYLAQKEQKEAEIRIEKDNTVLWADLDYLETDGQYFLRLTFANSMLRYLSDRYLDVTLIIAEETGLKIPNTAVTEKPFYLVPSDYISSTNGSAYSVYIKDSASGAMKKSVSLYNEDEESGICYIDCSALENGMQLIKPDSLETFTVHDTGTLQGVYCVNKGYAVFKQIREIYRNDEYSIIEEGTSYGISNYDFIALDSTSVQEDDIVY